MQISVPKDLVVFLEPSEDSDTRLGFAAALARRWQAHLIATFVVRELALDPHAGFAMGPAFASMLEEHSRRTTKALAKARDTFDALVHDRSFTAEWRVSEGEDGEDLMLHARHASLAVLGPPALQQAGVTRLGLSEQMIFGSGRPCLLLPEGWSKEHRAQRIVVGWNGGREAARSIADAMPFLTTAESVHLVVVPGARLRGAYGQEPGADMATHLARNGVPVLLEQHAGSDAGELLLGRCRALDAGLLVVGGCAHPRVGEFGFGRATRKILKTARVPLLMSR
jgi:nucleotide-binding universal stress UspA family protein